MFEIIQQFTKKRITEIKKLYTEEESKIIDEYINFLFSNDLCFYYNDVNEDYFSPLSFDYKSPSKITNAIISVKSNSIIVNKIVEQLDKLGCKAIQIQMLDNIDINELENISHCFNDSRIRDIQLLFPYNEYLEKENLLKLLETNHRITKLFVFGAPNSEIIFLDEYRKFPVYLTKQKIENYSFCGNIHPQNFTCNMSFFIESQFYNTCLNRKVCIDTNGNIKNCPNMQKTYGNIQDTTLTEAILKQGFKDYWFIKKDDIDVCQDCEFRHICTDCRAFIKDPENIYSQPSKCSYNPYIAKWEGQEGWISVEEWRKDNKYNQNRVVES
jgi:SPASM domain peptide maturase of grasp-with-spasm system